MPKQEKHEELCECGHLPTVHRYLNGRNWCAGSPGGNQQGGLMCRCPKYRLRVMPSGSTVKLLPCAHCGSNDIRMHKPAEDTFWVQCKTCGICTKYYSTSAKAARVWNTRVESGTRDGEGK